MDSWTGVCTDEWQSQHVRLTCCITIQLQMWSIKGHCFEFTMVTAWLYFLCCDSRYSPPARFPEEWQIFKIRDSLVLDSHRPLLADGAFGTSHGALQVFPALTAGGWCVWRPSWTALKQLAVTDGPQGMFTPAQQNKHFFFFKNVALYNSEKSCGEWAGPRALNGT